MISVVMATYNGEKYLERQINSILSQTLQPDEIVIFDDVSKDKTVDILYNFAKAVKNIDFRVFKHEQNKGYSSTFADAISEANGDIIFTSDQDDIWLNTKIADCVNLFKDGNVECISSGYDLIDDQDIVIKENYHDDSISLVDCQKIINGNVLPGFTLAFKKPSQELINLIKHEDVFAHDRLIELFYSTRKTFYIYNKNLNRYRIHNNNTSGLNLSKNKFRADRIERAYGFQRECNYLKIVYKNLNLFSGEKIEQHCISKIQYLEKRYKAVLNRKLFSYIFNYFKYKKVRDKLKICFYDVLFIVGIGDHYVSK